MSIIGRLQTRQWEDANKVRHWKTEIVANSVEMLSGNWSDCGLTGANLTGADLSRAHTRPITPINHEAATYSSTTCPSSRVQSTDFWAP